MSKLSVIGRIARVVREHRWAVEEVVFDEKMKAANRISSDPAHVKKYKLGKARTDWEEALYARKDAQARDLCAAGGRAMVQYLLMRFSSEKKLLRVLFGVVQSQRGRRGKTLLWSRSEGKKK